MRLLQDCSYGNTIPDMLTSAQKSIALAAIEAQRQAIDAGLRRLRSTLGEHPATRVHQARIQELTSTAAAIRSLPTSSTQQPS